ncbi:YgcG family protein [Dyella jejuensis]|uniref:YgcG family protein n=1 Tax=Dyella jejuensis TaxID=1432009 RepID=A0ABW8JJW4_9GAMM
MMRRWLRLWMLLAIALWSPWPSHADDLPAVPTLTRHVTDLTGTLNAQQLDQLDAQLTQLEKQKGAQLVVLMVGTTQPDDVDDYSLRVAEANKLGRKGVDDGVLLFIAKNDRQVRIEVGYGLEGAIPDAACARIIREYIAPKFRNNDYAGGIGDAVGALTLLINGEPLPPPVRGNEVEQRGRPDLHGLFFFAIVALLFLRGMFGRAPAFVRAPLGGLVVGGLLWLLASVGIGILGGVLGGLFMLLPAGAGRSIGGGGWGGWGGGGGFGGGGGGGFSGGGGSFGGGGASGSW